MTALAAMLICASAVFAHQPSKIDNALSHSMRPDKDLARDAVRKPASVLAFTGVSEGDQVLDLFAGGGWYTELFSRIVGEQGQVFAHNDEVVWQFAKEGMIARTENNRLPNVTRLDGVPVPDISLPDTQVDLVFTALNYHDLFFTEVLRNGKMVTLRDDIVNVSNALSAIKNVMKDDATFVIIDHHAKAGSGYDAANRLHRIDVNIVKHQMAEAGFELIEEAYYLQNPDDDRSKFVFDEAIRGNTDRFILKYRKSE